MPKRWKVSEDRGVWRFTLLDERDKPRAQSTKSYNSEKEAKEAAHEAKKASDGPVE